MNEITEDLIRDLAAELGTTAEALWSVLLHQAPISALSDAVCVSVLSLIMWGTYKLIRRKTTTPPPSEDCRHPRAAWDDEAGPVWTVWVVFALLVLIVNLTLFYAIITAVFNPEYWAIKQIIP